MNKIIEITGRIIDGLNNHHSDNGFFYQDERIEEAFACFINAGQRIKRYTLQFNAYPRYSIKVEGEDTLTRIVLFEKSIKFSKFIP